MTVTIKATPMARAKRRTTRSELRELLNPEVKKVVDRVIRTAGRQDDLDPSILIERAKPKLLAACEVGPGDHYYDDDEWDRHADDADPVDARMYGLALEVLADELGG